MSSTMLMPVSGIFSRISHGSIPADEGGGDAPIVLVSVEEGRSL